MSKLTLPARQPHRTSNLANYKPSIYNYFVDRGRIVWGANFRSRTLIRFSRKDYERAKSILDGAQLGVYPEVFPDREEDGKEADGLTRKLIEWQFLVANNLDEIKLLKVKNRASRFSRAKGLALIIAPTLRCNFSCQYCYVDRNANKMAEKDRLKVAKFFDKKLPARGVAEVVWTGGDPSLAMDVVEDLSLRFFESCKQKECSYKASLITNGYLLNDQMVAALKNSNIRVLQISLDGSSEFHNTSRHLPNGTATYDTILQNVERISSQFRIVLRVNVDARNHHAIPELIEDLERRGLKDEVYIYFAPVDDVNESSARYHDSCLPVRQYAKVAASLIRLALNKGFRLGERGAMEPVNTHCGANSTNYYVIDPKANLLKCYHALGAAEKRRIGEIGEDGEEVITDLDRLVDWLGWDPFEIDECRSCKLLPLCMGGCSDKIAQGNMNIERGCYKFRFCLDEIIDILGGAMWRNKANWVRCTECAAPAAAGVP